MRILAHVGLAYLLLVLIAAVWPIVPLDVATPLLPIVSGVYLGIAIHERLPLATAGAIAVGYLQDVLLGGPRGLLALLAGVAAVAARLLCERLLVRGRLYVAGFTAGLALVTALLGVALRAYAGHPLAGVLTEAWLVVTTALLSGLVAPPLFRLFGRLDAVFARTQREREALREGFLG